MRRVELSKEKLEHIIRLRQQGKSWLKIQGETGIFRRTAERAYKEWEHNQGVEALKEARLQVAAEEFRRHLNDLTRIGEALASSLPPLAYFGKQVKAAAVLDNLWQKDLIAQPQMVAGPVSQNRSEREIRRIYRRNRMLFDCLRDHTRGKVRWEALDEWAQAWDSRVQSLVGLQSEATQVLRNFLNQKPGLEQRIKRWRKGGEASMARGVVEAVLRAYLADEQHKAADYVRPGSPREGIISVVFGKDASINRLDFQIPSDLVEDVANVCSLAAGNLCHTPTLHKIAGEARTVRERTTELEEMLDSFSLRPLILQTRCKLCPA